MTIREDLAPKYIELYNRIRSLVNDGEVYPAKPDSEITELIRATEDDWLPVPSFGMTKKDIKESDMGHISIRVRNNKVIADLFFNGEPPIGRFLNILDSRSENEKREFIESIKNLGKDYKINILYDTKVPLSKPSWKEVGEEVHCFGLDDSEVGNILNIIKQTEDKRSIEQKQWNKKRTVTMAVRLARVEVDENDDSKIKEVFTNLAKLTRLAHRIKSDKEFNREVRERKRAEEKELPERYKERDILEKEILGDENFGISSGRTTKEAVEKKKEKLKKIKERIKEIEDGRVSQHDKK